MLQYHYHIYNILFGEEDFFFGKIFSDEISTFFMAISFVTP